MFIGAINSGVRQFLASMAPAIDGHDCVIGCSGNFTSETVLSLFSKPTAIYSNDVSLYSCLAGAYLTGENFPLSISDESLAWLEPWMGGNLSKLAAIMVLMDMLPFEKQDNAYKKRMWKIYLENFGILVEKTEARISNVATRITGYYGGDVFDHFKQHDTSGSIFMCYAPTYAGGYERLYKRLEQVFEWNRVTYSMLDDDARDRLLAWMRARKYVWYDDRRIDGMEPIMIQKSGRNKVVYIYTNLNTRPVFLADNLPPGLPKIPLATIKTEIKADSAITLKRILTSDLARLKNAFLGKNILFSAGLWAFAIMVDGVAIGFLEFNKGKYQVNEIYINSDFAVSSTRYKRLSKLVVMLAICGETRKMLEKLNVLRVHTIMTTAFTEKPVSMKYRGVMELIKRGKSEDGKQFLNYQAHFNDLTWKEVLQEWLTKHASKNS